MDKHLHIVTHDIPWPVDFGGMVDLFYKIKALHDQGIKIHLHCFKTDRSEQKTLNRLCHSVKYYQRKKGIPGFSFSLPYIVNSRNDRSLLTELLADDHPILFEGIHCTYFLQNDALKGRKIFVRLHNVEYKYYEQLAVYEKNIFRKTYFRMESRLLKKYERHIANKAIFLSVNQEDVLVYQREMEAKKVFFLPVFLPWDKVESMEGRGTYCLYHGNLSISENEKAADWLLSEIFNELMIPLVIAGKDPSLKLQAHAHIHKHTCMIINPSDSDLQDLIKKAQINILPSFNNTGVKLKLLNALFNGRHCLVNEAATSGSGLTSLCTVFSTPDECKAAVKHLYESVFQEEKMRQRDAALKDMYNSEKNVLQLIAWIY